jgi:hypothetical protein
MNAVVTLEWIFSPPDYFEEQICIERDGYRIVIGNGKAEAHITPEAYDTKEDIRDELHGVLNDHFLGVQLFSHKAYQLSEPSIHRIYPDGHKEITLIVKTAEHVMMAGSIDFVLKDKDGNVLSDSRRDRIEKKKELATLVEKYRKHDKFVDALLSFFEASIHDPNNELAHLFDVWEALVNRFGNEKAVKKHLAISESERRRLGTLANDAPLRQGRHRGKKIGDLRAATTSELEEARSVARKMIEAYLRYLEELKPSK